MSDFPKDAFEAARKAFAEQLGDTSASEMAKKGYFDSDNAVLSAAIAIMAERDRCIQICEDEYERRINSDYPADRRHDFVVVARSIQKAIREPVESDE